MAQNPQLKNVTVKEHAVQSMKEAGQYELVVPDGARIVAIANGGFPHYDKNFHAMQLAHIADVKPHVVFLLGGMADVNAFKALAEDEKNFLHTYHDSEPVVVARTTNRKFEDRCYSLANALGEYIQSFAEASPETTVIWIPTWVNLGLPNELEILEWIDQKKRYLDQWTARNLESPDAPSNPFESMPDNIAELTGINDHKRIQVLPFGAGVLLNGKTLFLGGSFRRRHAGDAAWVEWEQRGYSIVRGVDGKLSSGWSQSIKSTIPEPTHNWQQVHEVGYSWEAREYGHLGDYHRRCQGIFSGIVFHNEVFGEVCPFVRGADGRRSLFIQSRAYTEATPGGLPNGGVLKLYDPSADVSAADGESSEAAATGTPPGSAPVQAIEEPPQAPE